MIIFVGFHVSPPVRRNVRGDPEIPAESLLAL